MLMPKPRLHYQHRTIFISDIHLGTKGCQAEMLLDFLKYNEAKTWYLIGDIVDTWRLKRRWYWPQAHNDVLQKILRKARKGAKIIYVPGNHDEPFRHYCGTHFGGIKVRRNAIHTGADGRRFWVVHGDEFDSVVLYAKWLAVLGDYGYRTLLSLNTSFNKLRRAFGFGYWSLSAFIKVKVKNALQYIENYEGALCAEAKTHKVDGVICGHIHKAEIRHIDGVLYLNDGDWVESCTAIVEDEKGAYRIIEWARENSALHSSAKSASPTANREGKHYNA
jgi:UDP-2,3-diacylglucosamine pyrophosphatase LpxH